MSILTILNELNATRSKLDKEAILMREKSNEDLKNFFRLALNPFINFYQKKEFAAVGEGVGAYTLQSAMYILEAHIAARKATGNDAIEVINAQLKALTPDDAEVVKRILQKDPKCGVQTQANKAWPKLIPEYPCLLASPWDDKLASKMPWKTGVIMQKKSDGLRCNLHVDADGIVKAFTRAGNELNVHGRFDSLGQFFKGFVIDGELLTVDTETGKFNSRQVSNGICSKAIKNTMSTAEADMLHLVSWDIIPAEDFAYGRTTRFPYSARLATLQTMCGVSASKLISIVETAFANSVEEAQEFYQRMVSEGEEGAMAKDPGDEWCDKRLKTILKMKGENTADMRVVGFKEGTGKLVGNLGSLEIATDDGKCVTSMSGFTLKFRSGIYANLMNKPVPYFVAAGNDPTTGEPMWIEHTAMPGDCDVNLSSIIEVLYNQKIKARDTDVWSLFLPRFSKTRDDKIHTNNLEDLT